ncbi:membrane protein DedA, SNARE-associated domain [Desulfotomaculum arcticum]|uniref:Membrane protein DedA, SNARE-associated domain n=1 Tax=Desulfotruncus arcticus DSM 17038 TaxID=1121424 RepID=A0A1I2PNH1_9FIRM|nr:DedA family protein [Desulfotruncus arcticus]SFG16679.1 membrane protein DedA, SNARE-associated domain [Desulfotomaculum arcticum] [Desulfotruncus arcticus DSM 17038]
MLHQLIELLTSFATGLINTLGHWGVFIGMVLESACIPLPSEVIMLFGGFLTAQGTLNFWGVVWAGVLGNVVGSVLAFWAGANGGRPFLEKYGKYILFNHHHLDQADRWFSRYGEWAVFFGRILPVIRTFISLPAGIARMNFVKFLIFTLIGCIPWNIALTYMGLKLGQNWQSVEPYFRPVSYAIIIAVICGIIWFFINNRRKR